MLINDFNFTHVQRNRDQLDNSLRQLGTGRRITHSGADIAAFSMSTLFSREHTSLMQASRNIHDGIGLVQVLDSAVQEQGNVLTRMREILVQANSETYASTDRSNMRTELVELRREYEAITGHTNFNRITLLASSNTISIQMGQHNGGDYRLDVDLSTIHSGDDITTHMGVLGSAQGTGFTSGGSENLAAYDDAAFSALVDDGIDAIDSLLNLNSSRRTSIGGYQSRLEIALSNNHNNELSLLSAFSSITNVDYATQASSVVRHQVMMNASVTSLTQARGMSASVLSLL